MTSIIETDVLIIGAGPAGLMAANELQKRNVDFVCLEKRPGPTKLSKALGIQARTLELLEFLGIHKQFLKEGYPGPGAKLHLAGEKPSYVELFHIKSRYPYLFILPQNEIEALFIEHLEKSGGSIQMEHEVVDMSQSRDGILVTVSHNGRQKQYAAKYALACDGAHSRVRDLLGIDFVGEDEGYTFFTADVEIPGLNEIYINMHLNDRGAVAVFPYKDGSYRVVGMDRAKQGPPYKKELKLEELQESLDRILEVPYRVEKPRYLSSFGTAHRQVRRYRIGNVFFLGDAAHINNPLGGQGMNLGLEDASNLCWKIDTVLRGLTDESFLDSYNDERYPIAQGVIRDTTRELKAIDLKGPVGLVRNWSGKAALSQSWVQPRIANYLSHIHHEYHKVKRNKLMKNTGLSRKAVQPGQRVPDQKLFFEGKSSARLYQFIHKHGFVCLIYIDCYDEKLIHYAHSLSKLFSEFYPGLIKVFLVARGGTVQIEEDRLPIIYDVHRNIERNLGMDKGNALLIRPDGHVAFHDHSQDAQKSLEMLETFLK
ncbi:FAD-dependent monooxygenase [Jeotgalibacillus aurantiacus]|uniref:FAD-dependent monooxygenase n=1 Tax=Jeotgalibacillus aurantiacus TaxID=2763266 RepID=UPI001D0B64F5|nr:FAD-dependent monooxygenase [Jeotgalibacillus aurantiacus]